jgi:plastocyanin
MSMPVKAVRRAAAVAVVGAAVAIAAGAASSDEEITARAAANVTIEARDFFFSPDSVNIQVGDTVTWTNAQGFHNVLLGDSRLNQPGFPNDPAWNPPPSRTFDAAGSYTFICEVHPGMTGTVNVSGGGEPTPTPTPTPTPPPAVPPPGGATPDRTPPSLTGITATGVDGKVQLRLTTSERATITAHFATSGDAYSLRAQAEAGTWMVERALPSGSYTFEIVAVDAMGNRSATEVGEVSVRG